MMVFSFLSRIEVAPTGRFRGGSNPFTAGVAFGHGLEPDRRHVLQWLGGLENPLFRRRGVHCRRADGEAVCLEAF